MLRIPTYLASSRIAGAGLGLFAKSFVRAGTVIWRFDPGLDRVLAELPEEALLRRFVEVYGYVPIEGERRWVICLDDARFINHSDTPNTVDTPDLTVAAEDIGAGVEITSDYRAFCRDPFNGWRAGAESRSRSGGTG
ncbi:MAG TPA: SET domain-containing protein [Crenalkalicoccus sp.]|nr:SET domain-containing protein [Crenalkalicoccus sp.]